MFVAKVAVARLLRPKGRYTYTKARPDRQPPKSRKRGSQAAVPPAAVVSPHIGIGE